MCKREIKVLFCKLTTKRNESIVLNRFLFINYLWYATKILQNSENSSTLTLLLYSIVYSIKAATLSVDIQKPVTFFSIKLCCNNIIFLLPLGAIYAEQCMDQNTFQALQLLNRNFYSKSMVLYLLIFLCFDKIFKVLQALEPLKDVKICTEKYTHCWIWTYIRTVPSTSLIK